MHKGGQGVGAKNPNPSRCGSVSGCIRAERGGEGYVGSQHPCSYLGRWEIWGELVRWEGPCLLTLGPAAPPASPSSHFLLVLPSLPPTLPCNPRVGKWPKGLEFDADQVGGNTTWRAKCVDWPCSAEFQTPTIFDYNCTTSYRLSKFAKIFIRSLYIH